MRLSTCLILSALLAAPLACAQSMYQWKDAQGVTHYSDVPPPKSKLEGKPINAADAMARGSTPATAQAAPAESAQCSSARLNQEDSSSGAHRYDKWAPTANPARCSAMPSAPASASWPTPWSRPTARRLTPAADPGIPWRHAFGLRSSHAGKRTVGGFSLEGPQPIAAGSGTSTTIFRMASPPHPDPLPRRRGEGARQHRHL